MKISLFTEFGALNSSPIFQAFEEGAKKLGHQIVKHDNTADAAVIWSVLWNGRMTPNKHVYTEFTQQNKPVIIIEVGNLKRNITWRVSLKNINKSGSFGNNKDLDIDRPKKLGVSLQDKKFSRRPEILIATQHARSLQWEGMPTLEDWVYQTVNKIRKYSERKIIVRPHPRCLIRLKSINNVDIIIPKKIPNTYDDFDIDYNFHCVVNHNSGPCIQAAIAGVPVICDITSLAYPLSSKFENIENISLSDREDWFLKLCHTEWTIDEIAQGIPLSRLF